MDLYKKGIDAYLPVSGVNIIDNKGKLFVPKGNTFCGLYGDLCLFRIDEKSYFHKGENCEYLALSHKKSLANIYAYYHMKFIKRDFGLGNYDFKQNPYSHYYTKSLLFFSRLKFIPLETIVSKLNLPLISCQDVGIKEKRDYKKEALKYLKESGGKITLPILIRELKVYFRFVYLPQSHFYTALLAVKRKLKSKQ